LGWRATLTRVILGYSVLALPAIYLNYYMRDATPAWVNLVYALAPLAPVLIPLLGRTDLRSHDRGRIPYEVRC
jgi:hypothetical protein